MIIPILSVCNEQVSMSTFKALTEVDGMGGLVFEAAVNNIQNITTAHLEIIAEKVKNFVTVRRVQVAIKALNIYKMQIDMSSY